MKTALITGASGAIGASIVKELISDGYFVMGSFNRNESAVINLKKELEKMGKAEYFISERADLSKTYDANRLVERFNENFNHIDLLVLSAGVDLYKMATDTTEEEYDEVMNVNLKSGFTLAKSFLKQMCTKGEGKVIFVSSIWGRVGASMESVYSASKFALIGLTKSLAKEYGKSGITVNAVCPGVIDTPMNGIFTSEEMTDLKDKTPLGRIGSPEEVAYLVSFLASDKADFITGEAITLDGGFTL